MRTFDDIYLDIDLHKGIIRAHNEAVDALIAEAQEQALLKDGDVVEGGVSNQRYLIIGKPRLDALFLEGRARNFDLVYTGRAFGKGGKPLKWSNSSHNRDIYQIWIEEGKFKKIDSYISQK